MVSFSRRDLFWIGSAAGLGVLVPRARAQAIAPKIEDVSAEVVAGDFAAAVERLELEVAE